MENTFVGVSKTRVLIILPLSQIYVKYTIVAYKNDV